MLFRRITGIPWVLPDGIITYPYISEMYFVYVLFSQKDQKLYIGFTQDLELRIKQHTYGVVQSTKSRRPLELIYFEACIEKLDAVKREKYLKTHYGRLFLHKRLKAWFEKYVV